MCYWYENQQFELSIDLHMFALSQVLNDVSFREAECFCDFGKNRSDVAFGVYGVIPVKSDCSTEVNFEHLPILREGKSTRIRYFLMR